MIKRHKTLGIVPEDTVLWQYMPMMKYLDIIQNRRIHFHRLDDLADKEEGVLSTLDMKSFVRFDSGFEQYFLDERKRTFISCWIKSPHELSLMWESYGKGGVAIRTTAGHITEAMEKDKEHGIYMFDVHYIDKQTEAAHHNGEPLNMFKFLTTKRKFFEQEKEVRLIFSDTSRKHEQEKGINFDVDLNKLIQDVVISPIVPEYQFHLICQETKDAGIEKTPQRSKL